MSTLPACAAALRVALIAVISSALSTSAGAANSGRSSTVL